MMSAWLVSNLPSAGRIRPVGWLALALCLLPVQPALAAVPNVGRPLGILLQIEGIEGESTLPQHEGWMLVEGLDSGLTVPVVLSPIAGGGGDVPAAVPEAVTCIKELDKASPKLVEALSRGQSIPRARLEFYTLGEAGGLVRFYQLQLEDILISAYSLAGVGLAERPVERVRIDYRRVDWTYTEFAAEGKPLADHRAFWDFVQDKGGYEWIRRGFKVSAATETGRNGVRLRWLAEAGRKYRILRTDLLNGQFSQALPDIEATADAEQELWVPRDGPFGFFIITEVDETGAP